MRKNYSNLEKQQIINRYLCGETISSISNTTGIARSTLYSWINDYNENTKKKKILDLGDYNKLKMHCEKLENIITILKTCGCSVYDPLHQRFEVIRKLSSTYSIKTLCEALEVAKGSYYNHIFRNKNDDTIAAQRKKELTPVIEEVFKSSKETFGAGKVAAILNDRGYHTTEKTVSKIMHENGWFSIKSSAKTLYMQNKQRKENKLNQQFNPTKPNEVWVSDVTYYKYNNTTFYICVIIDLYARKLISLTISKRNSTWLTKTTLANAYKERNPDTNNLLFHSDQGMNYTATAFMTYLKKLGIEQSFSNKSMPYDNSVCESFFSSLKREELYRTNYTSEEHLRKSLVKYIAFYNNKRPHGYLCNRTPSKAEAEYYQYLSQKENNSNRT